MQSAISSIIPSHELLQVADHGISQLMTAGAVFLGKNQ